MIEIREVIKEDLPALHALAEEWLLEKQEKPEESGFLVSNFTLEQYQKYLETAEYFFLAEIDNQIAGFVLAYSKEKITAGEIVNSVLKQVVVEDFVLIKQICVSKKHPSAAVPLYEYLFAKANIDFILTAIVDDPLNIRSINFHKNMGFEFFTNILPPEDYDGRVRMRSIWIRKRGKGTIHPTLRIALQDLNSKIENLLVKQCYSKDLYMHEDNLNWTKLGMLVSFMMALSTGFVFILREPVGWTNALVSFLLIIIGYMIVLLFKSKIRSGIIYMQNHKSLLIKFDKVIKQMDSSLTPTLCDYTRKRSTTVKLIEKIPEICLALWTFISLTLISRYVLQLFKR